VSKNAPENVTFLTPGKIYGTGWSHGENL